MSERPFDQNWGILTHRTLTEYVMAVKRLTDLQARTELADDELAVRRLEIQKARDAVEFRQQCPREGFHSIFHQLQKRETQEIKDTLRRHREYFGELPTDFVDPDF